MRHLLWLFIFLGLGELTMAHSNSSTQVNAKFQFLFLMANDLVQIDQFYRKTLEVPVAGDPVNGWVDVNLGTHVIYFKGDYDLPVFKEWAWQPGYKGGSGNITSWSIEFPETEFRNLYERIKSSKVEMLNSQPEWRRDSYWGLTIKDPMGNTIELYTTPKQKPDEIEWH